MRWKCTVAYDGTGFEGWQAQTSGRTVQQTIEARLSELFARPVRIHGAGRTDSGVHARGQVFHFDGEWSHGSEALLRALRVGTPESICVYSAEVVNEDFHARYSATGKYYIYRFYEGDALPFETRYCLSLRARRVDVEAMDRAGKTLLGRHDFSAFGASLKEDSSENPVKELRQLEVMRDGSRLTLHTEGSGYMYKMVRSLAGCLLNVGLGKLDGSSLVKIRDGRKRTSLVVTAPARGLTLERVDYA